MRLAALLLLALATPAAALDLEACTRTTHVSHGGEAAHRDMGAGLVLWVEWWSQEGVYKDIYLANCSTGDALKARVQEERIGPRGPFDNFDRAMAAVAAQHSGSQAFFTLERVADALETLSRDAEIAPLTVEPCACASLYPEADAHWDAFPGAAG